MKSKTNRPKLVSVPTTPVSNVVRLRPMPTPAHLRTEFSPEDADIRTLVRNVLHGREKLSQIRAFVQAAVKEGHIGEHESKAIYAIIDQELE